MAEPQQQSLGAGAYMSPRDLYGSAIKELTDPSQALYQFEIFLRSYRQKDDGSLEVIGKPLMNDKGINAIMSMVQSIIHKSNTLSNFDIMDLETMYDTSKSDLITELMINRITYDVDRKNRFLIIGNAMRLIQGFMKRPYQEGDRKFWKGSVTEVKHTEEHNTQRGFSLNPFGGFKK